MPNFDQRIRSLFDRDHHDIVYGWFEGQLRPNEDAF